MRLSIRPGLPRPVVALAAVTLVLFNLTACTGYGRPDRSAAQLAFGVDMAKRGLWSEALFRFHEAERADPQNPRVHNDLGVAYEAQGDFEQALQHYRKALQLAPEDRDVRANYTRFAEYYQAFKGQGKGKAGDGAAATPGAGTPPSQTSPQGAPQGKGPAAPSPAPPQLPPGMNQPPTGAASPTPALPPPPTPAGKSPAPPPDPGSVPPPPPPAETLDRTAP